MPNTPVKRPDVPAGAFTPFDQRSGEQPEERLHLGALLWRHRWLIAACTVVAFGAGLLYIRLATPMYEATTSLRIAVSEGTREEMWAINPNITVSTDLEVLGSRSLVEDATRALNLQLRIQKPRRIARRDVLEILKVAPDIEKGEYRLLRQPDGSLVVQDVEADRILTRVRPGEQFRIRGASLRLAPRAALHQEIHLAVQSFADAVADVGASISVSRAGREADVLKVHYRSSDPELVWRVPNRIVESFIERRQEAAKTAARSQVRFLRSQLDTLSPELARAEEELKNYRERAQVVSPSVEASGQISRLIAIETDRSTLEAERSALAQLVAQADSQGGRRLPNSVSPYRRFLAFPTLLRSQAASQLLESLVEVEDQRSTLLARRTENDPDVRILTARIYELEEQVGSIARTYLEGLSNQISSVDASIARFSRDLQRMPQKELEYTRLERRPAVLKDMYTLLQTRLKEAEIAEAAENASVTIVDPAIPAQMPIYPRTRLTLFVAFAGGLLLGVGCALAVEYRDRSIRSRADVLTASGLPVIALIPRIYRNATPVALIAEPGKRRRVEPVTPPPPRRQLPAPHSYTFLLSDPPEEQPEQPSRSHLAPPQPLVERVALTIPTQVGVIAEAYGILQTNIAFSRVDTPAKTLVFTSPLSGDGKTTTVVNLALALAQRGVRVLLIDADVRRGVVHSVFRSAREPGLSEVLRGLSTFETARRGLWVGERGMMDYLTTGKLRADDVGLVSSDAMRSLLARVREEYDLVILDTPPVNIITDAAVLAASADGVVLVARAGVTEAAALSYAVEQLRHVRASVLGVVLNDIDLQRDSGYDSTYKYFKGYEYSTSDR